MKPKRPENLKDALVDQAFAVIEDKGVEELSMREIARRLGVSHQAPYKHFQSRDHILAAVIARCFKNFADHILARPEAETAKEDLLNMGLAYLDFAQSNPLQYRLMFNTPLPPMTKHPEMLAKGEFAFAQLLDRLETMDLRPLGDDAPDPSRKHDAVFIWSTLHGYASLMQAEAMTTVGLTEEEKRRSMEHLFHRMGLALNP